MTYLSQTFGAPIVSVEIRLRYFHAHNWSTKIPIRKDDHGYVVLEFPRGPQIGSVYNVGTRLWCSRCLSGDWKGEGRTRVAAANVLAIHARREHGSAA